MQLEWFQIELRYRHLRVRDELYIQKLSQSLLQIGQQTPVIVVQSAENYILIDGYQRVFALRLLGRDRVTAVLHERSESDCLLFSYGLEHNRKRSALEEGWLLCELLERFNLTQGELCQRLGRNGSWLSRRIGLVKALPEAAQELVRKGKLCAYGAMKYLVPLARANKRDCEQLAIQLSSSRYSSRALEKLYKGWKCSAAEERRKIVENPAMFLATMSDKFDSSAASRLEHKLKIARSALWYACHEFDEELSQTGLIENPAKVRRLWRAVVENHTKLNKRMEDYTDVEV